jgi:hypothetical protein
MAERDFITLEEAFERSDYSLEPLYKAAEAWFPNKKHTEAMGPRFAFAESLGFQPLKDEKRLQLAYERERKEARAHLVQLIAGGEQAIEIRLEGRLDMPWTPLQPDNVQWLSIEVDDPAAESLSLHRPDGKRLDCRTSRRPERQRRPRPRQARQKIPLKKLLEDITGKLPFPAPAARVHGWKKDWATKAAHAINQRQQKEPKRVKGTTARSVQNRMGALKLWPE